MAVSGAVEEHELLALAERWFGQEAATPLDSLAPAAFVGGEARLNRKIEQANLVFQLPSMGALNTRLPALRLFTEILGGGMASRLGDVVVAMRDDGAVMTRSQPREFGLVGMHGSLTELETRVPLLVA